MKFEVVTYLVYHLSDKEREGMLLFMERKGMLLFTKINLERLCLWWMILVLTLSIELITWLS